MYRFIYITVLAFASAYVSLARSGLFSEFAPKYIDVIYSLPLYMASFVLLLAAIADVIMRPGGRVVIRWALLVALALLTAGYWVGGLMSFNIDMVITEGQRVVIPDDRGAFRSVYVGKYARIPYVSLTLGKLSPSFSPGGDSIKSLGASFLLLDKEGNAQDIEMGLGKGHSGNGLRLSVEGFGYSPRYVLMDKGGRQLDSSFVYLRIFPPGSEDSFRLLSPLTYYIRYYPEGEGGPHFYVRVARNRDLVFSGNVSMGEAFRYENASMSLPEVRQWTRLGIKGNPGRPLLALGLLVLLFCFALQLKQRIRP